MNIFEQVFISIKNVGYWKDISQSLLPITLITLKDGKLPLEFVSASCLSLRVNYSRKIILNQVKT